MAGWDLHPLEKRRLTTAHTRLGHFYPEGLEHILSQLSRLVLGQADQGARELA